MKRNRTRLTQLIIILLIAAVLIILKNQLPQFLIQKPNQPFSSLKKEQIREMLLTKNKPVRLYKKDKFWYVKKDNNEFRAEEERINKIIDSFINLKKDNIVSSNKKKHKELGIDKQKMEINAGGKSYAIYLGNNSGLSNNYIRIDNEDDVFVADGFGEAFTSDDYRDLSVHLINDEAKVTSIEIGFEDRKTVLNKKDNDWKIGDKTAKKDRVDFFLNDLKTLKASDIFTKDTNLPNVIPITIRIKEGKQEKTIEFYPQDENNYLAKASTSEFVFQIPAAYVASLKKEGKDFIE